MSRSLLLLHSALFLLVPLFAGAPILRAQEYLDTAGRWKRLVDPGPPGADGFARAIGCARGSVLVSRDSGVLLFSADSGETFRDLRAERRLDTSITIVWAIAWPDTISEPDRVVAIANFRTPDRSPLVRLITSSDGGLNWSNGPRLPTLDTVHRLADAVKDFGAEDATRAYLAAQPPFIMQFHRRRSGGTLGLIATLSGLLASEDNGRTWSVRCDSIPFGLLTMADENNGVAYGLPRSRPALVAALRRTSDGGRSWKWVYPLTVPYHYATGLHAFDPRVYRLLTPDVNSLANEWNVIRSIDSGKTWWAQQYRGTGAALTMDNYWLDTTDLHLAVAFGDVRHSTNGGQRWHVLHPSEDHIGTQPLYRANLTAYDGRYIYYASNRHRIGRWRIARRVQLPTSVGSGDAGATAGVIAIYPNPAAGDELNIYLDRADDGPLEITLYDPLGRIAATRSLPSGAHAPFSIPIGDLSTGRYLLRVRSAGSSIVRPVVILHR